jgi:hypothetical protein
MPTRILEAHIKSNSVITHEIVDNELVFTVVGAGKLTFQPQAVSETNRHRAELHGWIQRISDAAAISRDPETGKPATALEKYEAMKALVDHYETGTSEWSRVRVGGGEVKGQLFKALCVIYPAKTPDDIRAWLDGKSKDEKKALRQSKKVRDAIASFTDGSEGDDILAELE